MRATIYGRNSSGNQKSITDQIDECGADAADQGWDVASTLSDGTSASQFARKARENWKHVLAEVEAKQTDVLILWDTSRGSRENTAWSALLDSCEENGVLIRITSHDRTYDVSNDRDWQTLAEEGVDNAAFARKHSKKVRRGMSSAAAKGRPVGKRAYGYDREYETIKGRPVLVRQFIREDQAVHIREAAHRVRAGDSCYEVAADFNARGITAPRGGSWDLTQIRRMVINPQYAARRVYQKQIVGTGDWPAILDDDVWLACVNRMSDPKRKTVRDTSIKHLLSGIARCGVCDGPLRVQKNRGNFTYTCITKNMWCTGLKVQTFEDFIHDLMVRRLQEPDVRSVLEARKDDTGKADKARTQVRELRERLEGFYLVAGQGKLSPAGLVAVEADLLPQIQAAQERAVVASIPPVVRQLLTGDPKLAGTRWHDLTLLRQREALMFFMTIRLDVVGKGHRVFRPERIRIDWH